MKNKTEEIAGFPDLDAAGLDDIHATNAKGKNNKAKKSGGFQSMGLSYELIKGITKRGYKVPTPIQRKTIPLILEGRDVVAMAKTGSGKTACFLIPLFERLKQRDPTKGARALILSPTRELAVQTFKFIKELGRFMNLKNILVLGGDSMDSQFSAIHTCPDIIVATPGRFLHLCVEMDLKLNAVEYVVFDEADRLFEMGFAEQLNEILHRLPSSRQMVMFSATLPKQLTEFARAGLSDPVLIRLDVDTKIPDTLALKFIYCRPDERYTALVILLKYVIPTGAQTVVFAATQHHVELLTHILTDSGITNACVYSNLDPAARKINTAKFINKKVSVLLVTDVAARGIDIPSLDYVVSLHFPGMPKLFVHRVGRCARAGRTGTAYSICSTDDLAHLLDLHMFLNRTLDLHDNNAIGSLPQELLEEEHAAVKQIQNASHISGVFRTSENAYKRYIASRPVASTDANARVKSMSFQTLKPLEDFLQNSPDRPDERRLIDEKHDLVVKMRQFKPAGTIFELTHSQKSLPFVVMKEKRAKHAEVIEKFRTQRAEQAQAEKESRNQAKKLKMNVEEADEEQLKESFDFQPKRKVVNKKKQQQENLKDTQNFISYQSADKPTEDGLAINSFEQAARNAEFSVVDRDKNTNIQHKQGMKRWDRIKKKMVPVQDPRIGKIRTESGAWIPSSFKTGRYTQWKEKSKIEEQLEREAGSDDESAFKQMTHEQRYPVSRHKRHVVKLQAKQLSGQDKEMRHPEQIVKARMRLEFIKRRNIENAERKAENRKRSMRKNQRAKASQGKGGRKK